MELGPQLDHEEVDLSFLGTATLPGGYRRCAGA